MLIMSLLCGLLVACGKKPDPDKVHPDKVYDEYIEAVLTDWMRYISVQDNMYEDLNWALSYIEAFTNDPDWGALLNARAAVELVMERIELREEPEWSAQEEAYNYFMEREKDVSFIQPELETFEYNRNSMLQTCNMLRYALMADSFLLDGIPRTSDTVATIRGENNSNLRYLALSTSYLLLELNDAEWTEKVRKSMLDFCPQISAVSDPALIEKEQVEAAASDVLDELADLITEKQLLLGRSRADSDLLAEYINQGNDAAIDAMLSNIDGLPTVLPDPGWELASGRYFWTNEDGSRRYLTKKEDLTSPPESCILEYADVTEPEVIEYISLLYHDIGLDGEWVDGENDFYNVYFQAGDSVFVVSWSEEGAAIYMLRNPVCLAPDWFIPNSN